MLFASLGPGSECFGSEPMSLCNVRVKAEKLNTC